MIDTRIYSTAVIKNPDLFTKLSEPDRRCLISDLFHMTNVIVEHPQFIDYFDFNKIDDDNIHYIMAILLKHPHLANHKEIAKILKNMSDDDMYCILLKHPQLHKNFNVKELLFKDGGINYAYLLCAHPDIFDEIADYSEFSKQSAYFILLKCPNLIDRFDNNLIKSFSDIQWQFLMQTCIDMIKVYIDNFGVKSFIENHCDVLVIYFPEVYGKQITENLVKELLDMKL